MTSNPTIFEKAIVSSGDYEDALRKLVADGRSTIEIYEQLAIEDIRGACDLMLPLFQESGGVDGRISLEVLPELATATDKTVAEGLRLAAEVGRPNVMIKVPATPEGIPAIRALTAKGVSVNVTLIFSLLQYEEVVEAYLAGLEDRVAAGGKLDGLASVASFFVSRVDSVCDKLLKEKAAAAPELAARCEALLGQARDRQRQDGVRDLRAHDRGAALGEAGRGRRAAAAPALGVDGHQGSALPGHLLRRRADRAPTPSTRCRPRRWTPSSITASRRRACRGPRRAPSGRWRSSRRVGLDLSRVCHGLLDDGVKSFITSMKTLLDAVGGRRAALLESALGPPAARAAGRARAGHRRRRRRAGEGPRAGAHLGGRRRRSSPPTRRTSESIKSRLGWLRVAGADADASSPSCRRSRPT